MVGTWWEHGGNMVGKSRETRKMTYHRKASGRLPKTPTKPLLKKCVGLFSSCPIDSFLHSHAIVFVRKQPPWFFLGCKDVVSGQG